MPSGSGTAPIRDGESSIYSWPLSHQWPPDHKNLALEKPPVPGLIRDLLAMTT